MEKKGGKGKKDSSDESSPQVQTPVYTKIILGTSLLGKYSKLEDILKTLQNLQTFTLIEKLDINSDERIYPLLTSDIELVLYSEKGVDNIVVAK